MNAWKNLVKGGSRLDKSAMATSGAVGVSHTILLGKVFPKLIEQIFGGNPHTFGCI